MKKGSFMGSAFKLGTELVAAVKLGQFGFILDNWFDTKPANNNILCSSL